MYMYVYIYVCVYIYIYIYKIIIDVTYNAYSYKTCCSHNNSIKYFPLIIPF